VSTHLEPPHNRATPLSTMSTYQPPPGRLGNLTPEQEQLLEQFRKELTKEGWIVPARHDDATLLRFLRARKFDLVKAKEMFIAAEKWRKDYNVDDIVKSVRAFFRANHPGLMKRLSGTSSSRTRRK
jgi:hypothetical protein